MTAHKPHDLPDTERAAIRPGATERGANKDTSAGGAATERVGRTIEPETSPLYTTSVYTFPSLSAVEDYYDKNPEGRFVYRRNGHPNEIPVENAIAKLEGAESAVLTSTGMSAIAQACMAHLSPGHHVIATSQFYGGTYALFEQILRPWGVEFTYVDLNDRQAIESAIRPNTHLIFAETISNPLVQVTDLSLVAEVAKKNGLKWFVDNTFATPFLVRPVEWGATLSIESLTKYLNGHSDVIAGVVAGNREDVERIRRFAVTFGGTISPFDAWLTERGLQTFRLRFGAQCDNAMQMAEYLQNHPKVKAVYYPGLLHQGTHHIARRILVGGYGAMLSFELEGGYEAADEFVKKLQHVHFAPSLGGVHTTLSHPGLTSHRAFTAAERQGLGIPDSLLRMSLGIETPAIVIADIEQALS